ncbi:MAG TPA: hypothetical protein DEP23_09850 [Ruminococcaceae bacterium]|nr:hypothetical protein [Oscillospiraceae bacterium]
MLLIFGPNIVSKIIGFKFLYEGAGEVIKAVQQILEDGEITWETFTQLIGGAGGAIFGLGLILGKPKVAGFGLILWGASEMFRGLTDMINGNGDAWKNFERIVSGVAAVVGGIFLLLGGKAALMALAVGALALGILYLSQNWDKLTPAQRVLTILGALAAAAVAAAIAIAIFHTAWSVGIAAAAIAGGLALLAGTYLFTKSKAEIPTSGGASLSAAQSFGNQSFSGNPLPRLAKGAVLPANKEFAAVLGDQRYGRNIETPEGLLRGIFREEMERADEGNIDFTANITMEDGAVVGRVKRRFTRSGRLVGVYS